MPPTGGRRKRAPPPTVLDSGELEWDVEAILYRRERKHRGKGRGKTAYEYFVKWKGYGMEEATWEPAENLNNCQEKLQEFKAIHGDAPAPPQPAPGLDERTRGNTHARSTAGAGSEAEELPGKRRRKRMNKEGAANLRRSARLRQG